MIKSYEDYKFYLEADKLSLNQKKNRPSIIGDLRNDIWKFQRLLRKLEYIRNCKTGPIYKVYYYYLRMKYQRMSYKLNFEVPLNVCGPGLCLVHSGTIIINGLAKIGANCRIHSGVNIGTIDSQPNLAPIIGDNVYIGPGAKIYGNITIGNNTSIGTNAVVNKSFVEGNITVVGVPARKISDKNSQDLLIQGTLLVNNPKK